MDKTLFLNSVVEELNDKGMTAILSEIEKNGVKYHGISVKVNVGDTVGFNIRLDSFFEEGKSVDETVSYVLETIRGAENDKPNGDEVLSIMDNLDEVLKRVRIYCSKENTYKECVRREENGITLTIAILLECGINGQGSIRVRPEMLDKWNISEDDLWKQAKANSENHVVVKGMCETMVEMMGREQAELFGLAIPKEEEEVFVVSSEDNVNGAYGAFTEYVKAFVKDFGADKFYVLPSSIHECLVIPFTSKAIDKTMTEDEIFEHFKQMVREVNATQVAEEDRLSDTPLLLAI